MAKSVPCSEYTKHVPIAYREIHWLQCWKNIYCAIYLFVVAHCGMGYMSPEQRPKQHSFDLHRVSGVLWLHLAYASTATTHVHVMWAQPDRTYSSLQKPPIYKYATIIILADCVSNTDVQPDSQPLHQETAALWKGAAAFLLFAGHSSIHFVMPVPGTAGQFR